MLIEDIEVSEEVFFIEDIISSRELNFTYVSQMN